MTSQILNQVFRNVTKQTGAGFLLGDMCCSSCSCAELNNRGHKQGFYFHEQDAERAHEGGMCVGYFAPLEIQQRMLAGAIVSNARFLGLQAEWEGQTSKKVWIGNLWDWDPEPWRFEDEDEYYEDFT